MSHTLPAYPTRIQARIHVVELTHSLSQSKEQITSERIADTVLKSLAIVQENWENVIRNATNVRWDVSVGSILTTSLWSSVQIFGENPKLE